MKVFTLFFSGSVPGEYTTQLTTLPVGPDGQPLNRNKRDISDDISPTKVEPILKTDIPTSKRSEDWENNPDILYIEDLLDELFELNELQGSIDTPSSSSPDITKTVTITETLTKTNIFCNGR